MKAIVLKKIEMFKFFAIIATLCLQEYYVHAQGMKENQNTTFVPLTQKRHACLRPCVKDKPPMVCRYQFEMEWYKTMSRACHSCPFVEADCSRPDCIPGDGSPRNVLVINRQLPGTSVEVCLGDEVIVDVQNNLIDMATTIHWHGHPQRGTPYMDGVPMITQCPIQPGTTFRYSFLATVAGTHMWHSHSGMQRTDGAFGSYIVRVPDDINPHKDRYDFDLPEHTFIITDWMEHTGMEKFISHYHSSGNNKPTSALVNGKGRFVEFKGKDGKIFYTPVERFTVKKGYSYRFRLINVSFMNCPLEISVDNHKITVISTDGHDIEPQQAESLVTYAGERFDFILTANQKPDSYWIRFRGLMDCDERFTSAFQVAVLQYAVENNSFPKSKPTYTNSKRAGLQVNALNKAMEDSSVISIPQLKSLERSDKSLASSPDFKFFISYDFYKIDNPHYHKKNAYGFYDVESNAGRVLTPQLNHITMKGSSTPLLQSRYLLSPEIFCNESTVRNCDKEFCECPHVIQLALGTVVEMILIDKGFAYDANHPFHLHGSAFRVIGMERVGSNVTVQKIVNMDKNGKLKRNLKNPPLKDTVTVPDGGYTILRFVADNPGFWLFHCHIEFHAEIGMALVFKIGENDEMPPVPENFPECGNFYRSPTKTPPPPEKLTEEKELTQDDKYAWWWYNIFSSSSARSTMNQMVAFIFLLSLLLNKLE